MRVLKLRAVYPNKCARTAEQNFGCCFDGASLSCSRRTQKEERSYGTPRCVQPGLIDLIDLSKCAQGPLLADHSLRQFVLKKMRFF